ncbi:hypothetical protein GWP85_03195 [Acinetobacter beijerinckii]|uniref:hypothetical protein n=1 Tax=Acinetobacter beijerinckii TaxID=262668 RepID=UPI0023DDDB08|nr:hypothetical protein [Acinetobacter beijerinckii]MDF2416521.1 hypothetical protein [Acinetobacter beijerinckii]
MNQVFPVQTKKVRLQRIKDLPLYLAAGATVAVLSATNANAAGEGLDMTPLTDGIASVSTNTKLLFAAALTVIALFVAWRYTKRGANSA